MLTPRRFYEMFGPLTVRGVTMVIGTPLTVSESLDRYLIGLITSGPTITVNIRADDGTYVRFASYGGGLAQLWSMSEYGLLVTRAFQIEPTGGGTLSIIEGFARSDPMLNTPNGTPQHEPNVQGTQAIDDGSKHQSSSAKSPKKAVTYLRSVRGIRGLDQLR